MPLRQLPVRLLLMSIALVGGFMLLREGSSLPPASATRQQALRALAPSTVRPAEENPTTVIPPDRISPVTVDLADIPPRVYDPNNQYDRWLRGEIDLDEGEGLVSKAELARLQAESRQLSPNDSIQPAANGPQDQSALEAPHFEVAFDALDFTDCCGGGGSVPPDPELAAGPNHLIAVVNVAFEIYSKSGASLTGPITFSSFMSAIPDCAGAFDPNVIYDESANRFIMGVDARGDYYCLAVSQSGDPTRGWHIYAFLADQDSNDFFDYPHAGVGREAIYMGANIFSESTGFFIEARIWAFDKQAMYAGQSARFRSRDLPQTEGTPQPLHLHGWHQGTWPSGGPHSFFTSTGYNGATYSVFAWDDPFGANELVLVGRVDLESFTGVDAGMPLDVPQRGGQALQANDHRPQDFEFRNGYAWSVQTIACNPGGGTVDCVRWVQLDPATATVIDAGVYASKGEYRFFGDLAVNHCDDMALGYTKSSSGLYPAIWYSGRLSGDTPGTLRVERALKAGEIAYTAFDGAPFRWGDYTEMTIDPNGVRFWYLGQYSKDTGTIRGRWGTHIGSFSFPCSINRPDLDYTHYLPIYMSGHSGAKSLP